VIFLHLRFVGQGLTMVIYLLLPVIRIRMIIR